MVRAILFDFNGVIVDDEQVHFELFRDVLREEGVELTADDYYSRYLGLDDRGCFQAALEAAGEAAPTARLPRLIARKAAYYQAHMREHGFPVFPGAADLIAAAAEAGMMLGVVSGALRDEVEGALAQLALRDLFKVLVTAEDVAESKPHPEGYRLGLEGLNGLPPLPSRLIHPHETVAIEDSAAGLAAAAACGLSTLGVAHTYPASELSQADRIVASTADLTVERLRALFAGG